MVGPEDEVTENIDNVVLAYSFIPIFSQNIIRHISILKWHITVPYHVLMTKMKVSSKKIHNAIITYICASSLPPYR